jgi:lipoteichoic acid synthase
MDESDISLEPYDSNSDVLNNYFPAVRYMDEAIEDFFIKLKETGLYENSVFVVMGDHIGVSANHNKALSMYLDKDEITPIDQVELQRVPFIVHIPGNGKGKVISEVTGQIDVKPTLLSLLGIDAVDDIQFGNDLFADNRKGYVALRNGDFISKKFIYTNGSCYLRGTGELIGVSEEKDYVVSESEHALVNACNEINEKVTTELRLSDDLIYGDLFRFINFDLTKKANQ